MQRENPNEPRIPKLNLAKSLATVLQRLRLQLRDRLRRDDPEVREPRGLGAGPPRHFRSAAEERREVGDEEENSLRDHLCLF